MLTCKGATQLVSEGQERSLGLRERLALRLHLWICENCRRFDRQIRLLRRAMRIMARRSETGSQARDLSPEARECIRKAMAGQDKHPY